ncbi:tyrosine-protein phosphatase [Endozoicomonas ascidiicola]|uniref:tyrosine-protein phosphatase n=1 Tax=Endozoicomonas ascidiicola TaxID=1698521 RepID=UPI00082A2180|nr:CpsB/CapC family capsule biosynthesis tyrosine phosphatase [Endozoicomonas ascidiicola]
MIDIHNHIIPAIDDGPATMAQALDLLKMAEQDGIQRLVCTPHMHPGRYDNDVRTISPAFNALIEKAMDSGINIQLAMAAEVRFSDEMMIQLNSNRIPMLGQWQGQSCILLEMPHQRIPIGIDSMLGWLARRDVRVIIAHPERNKEVMIHPERIFPLVERGALLQLTAGSVTGAFGEHAQSAARWFLDKEIVQFVASDAHNSKRRPPSMKAASLVLKDWYGQEMQHQLTWVNPNHLTESLFLQSGS